MALVRWSTRMIEPWAFLDKNVSGGHPCNLVPNIIHRGPSPRHNSNSERAKASVIEIDTNFLLSHIHLAFQP